MHKLQILLFTVGNDEDPICKWQVFPLSNTKTLSKSVAISDSENICYSDCTYSDCVEVSRLPPYSYLQEAPQARTAAWELWLPLLTRSTRKQNHQPCIIRKKNQEEKNVFCRYPSVVLSQINMFKAFEEPRRLHCLLYRN